MTRQLLAAAVLLLALSLGVAAPAWATGGSPGSCNKFEVAFSPSSSEPLLPNYDPFSGESVLAVTITVKNKSSGTCDAALYFRRYHLPPVMTRGSSSTLQYAIEGPGGQSLVQSSDWPGCVPGNRIDLYDIPKNQSRQVTVNVRVPAGQVRPAGLYADTYVNLVLVKLGAGHHADELVLEKDFKPKVKIIAKCVLPAPNPVAHNFSPAIGNGLPNPAVTRKSIFSNVQCTAPARLRLSGEAMRPTVATASHGSFDNFINWHAAATFGAASADLSTNIANQVTSTGRNVANGPTLNASFDVIINLLRGKPLIAGSYAGTLTVAIDPNF